jgi:sugar transferase (PEP-CTERM/EpsH1 system associated)
LSFDIRHSTLDIPMRILFLTPQFPYPPHKGTTLRNYHLIAGLTALAARHEIDLLTFVESEDELRRPTPLLEFCRRMDGVVVPRRRLGRRLADTFLTRWPDMGLRLWSPAFASKLATWLADGNYDIVQVEGIELARYVLPAHHSSPVTRHPLLVFDDHNCEYLLQQRTFETDIRISSRWIGAAYSFVQWRKLRAFESAICRAADHVVAVSDADAAALQRLVPGLTPTVVPNGIDVASYTPTPPTLPLHGGRAGGVPDLVFSGTMDFRPNVDAALWFAQEALPLVRQEEPGARFVIVGQKPHRRLDVLRDRADVLLTGTVEDTRPYIAGATIYIVPLRMGGGTRFKILEAAAMSRAIVSTSLGCEGFPVENGRELVIADSPRQFADAVVALLRDPSRRAELGAAARAFVQAYDWKNIIPRMEAVYTKRDA